MNRLKIEASSFSGRVRLTHRRAESRVEGFVVEIEVPTGLDHVAHDTAEA